MDSDELYDSLDEDISKDDTKQTAETQLNITNSNHSDKITVLFERGFRPTSSESEDFGDSWLNFSKYENRKQQPEIANQKQKGIKHEKSKVLENPKKIEAEYDLSEVIPLYDREMPKTSLKGVGRESHSKKQISGMKSKKGSSCDVGRVLADLKGQRTYSNIFYAKMGRRIPEKKELTESARAQYGDETNRSNVSEVSSHFSDAKSSISDSTSFYMSLLTSNETVSSTSTITTSSKLESDSEFNFKSISQCFEQRGSPTSVNTCTNRKTKSKLCLVTPPVLGSLGPDMEAIQEKLSLLKKRRSYGQRVSDRNRIKIKEMKVLKDLTEEIRKARL